MRVGPLLLAAVLPVTLCACGQSDTATLPENEAAANEAALGNDTTVAPSGTQDFVNKAAASDRFQLETSRLVANSAASRKVVAFAQEMIAAQTESAARLKSAIAKDPSGITIDDQLSPAQQAALEDMKTKKGYLFDAAYLAALVHGQDQTLTELKNYSASGDNVALKEFAQGMIPTVIEHLEKAKTLTGQIGPAAR